MFFNDIKKTLGKVHINATWCKGCEFCVQYCPTKVLEMSAEFNAKGYHPPYVKNPEACTDCKFCQLICPEFSIFVTRVEDNNTGETEK